MEPDILQPSNCGSISCRFAPMNPEKSGSHASLDRVLRDWKVDASLAPRFNERVWHRIEREEVDARTSLWAQWMGWINVALTQRSLALAYLSVLILAGLLAGYWHARHDNAQTSEELSSRYVRLMDPYQGQKH